MIVEEQSAELVRFTDNPIDLISDAGRVCYRSDKSNDENEFIRRILKNGHESVIEHVSATFKLQTDRATLGELTRHRLASFSVESTRYCNYASDRFDNSITVIRPLVLKRGTKEYVIWEDAIEKAERAYIAMLDRGVYPETARFVLPMSLKTTMYMTANIREWRHIIELRCSQRAHYQIRGLIGMVMKKLTDECPVLTEYL